MQSPTSATARRRSQRGRPRLRPGLSGQYRDGGPPDGPGADRVVVHEQHRVADALDHPATLGRDHVGAPGLEELHEVADKVLGAIEEFAQEFAQVIRRFLKLKDWKNYLRRNSGFRRKKCTESEAKCIRIL